MLDFSKFEVISFDCYGTLIDWEQGILNALQPILRAHKTVISDDDLLPIYAEAEASIERAAQSEYLPYRDVLRQVTAQIAERLKFYPTYTELAALAKSIANWPPFADSVEALRALKSRFRLAIVSNIDDDLFEGSAKHLQVAWDWVITAQQCRTYKPSEAMFRYAWERIDLPKEKILHVAQSIYHDIVPANRLGQTTVWINRRGNRPGPGATPQAQGKPGEEFPNLRSLVERLDG